MSGPARVGRPGRVPPVYGTATPGLVEAAVGTLRELDVPDSQLHLDPFEF